jgi:hypothetical protein
VVDRIRRGAVEEAGLSQQEALAESHRREMLKMLRQLEQQEVWLYHCLQDRQRRAGNVSQCLVRDEVWDGYLRDSLSQYPHRQHQHLLQRQQHPQQPGPSQRPVCSSVS